MEALINKWSSSSSERGFHRTKLSELTFELRLLQDGLPKDQQIGVTSVKVGEVLRKKSRDAIDTAYYDGKDWYIWRGSERTVADKSVPTRPVILPTPKQRLQLTTRGITNETA